MSPQERRKAPGKGDGRTRGKRPAAPATEAVATDHDFLDPWGASGSGTAELSEVVGEVALWSVAEAEHEATTPYGSKLVLRANVQILDRDGTLNVPLVVDVWSEAVRRAIRGTPAGGRIGGVLVMGDRGFYLRALSQLEATALRAALALGGGS